MANYKVSVIGSGNVATNLAHSLYKNSVVISSIYSKNYSNAQILANNIEAKPVNDLSKLDFDVDFVIISVKDDVIGQITNEIPKSTFVLHTSGAIDISVLSTFNNYGIIYPLQTFSKDKILRVSEVPFFIEGCNRTAINIISSFVKSVLSKKVYEADSNVRSHMHLAAVLSNNFSTQLLIESSKILNEINLDVSVLQPLMNETMRKIFDIGPRASITGPAIRKDKSVIEKHISQLRDQDLKDLYRLMTTLIQKQ